MEATVGDLYEAYFAASAAIDAMVEFWLMVTFATIAATFIAGQRITRSLFSLVSFLYCIASIALMIGFYARLLKVFDLGRQLANFGETFPSGFPFNMISILSVVMMFVGTIGTLFFIWQTYGRKED